MMEEEGRRRTTKKGGSNDKRKKPSVCNPKFKNRMDGLKKKAYELSTLVDIDVCVIMLNPDGSPSLTWPEDQSEVQRIVQRFQEVPAQKRRKCYGDSFPSSQQILISRKQSSSLGNVLEVLSPVDVKMWALSQIMETEDLSFLGDDHESCAPLLPLIPPQAKFDNGDNNILPPLPTVSSESSLSPIPLGWMQAVSQRMQTEDLGFLIDDHESCCSLLPLIPSQANFDNADNNIHPPFPTVSSESSLSPIPFRWTSVVHSIAPLPPTSSDWSSPVDGTHPSLIHPNSPIGGTSLPLPTPTDSDPRV